MSIDRDLRRAFEMASLKREAKLILTPGEWQTYRKIEDVHNAQRQLEDRRYRSEYETRVETARKRLINSAAAKGRNFTHRWFGADRFDKDAIDRQARRTVQDGHHRRLAAIDKMQAQDIRRLLQRCEKSRELSEGFTRDFSFATDRRTGPERRAETSPVQSKIHTRRREP